MRKCGTALGDVNTPADPSALVDLLMHLEHFSILPEEISGRPLAFYMLRTVRLSLRAVTKYRKYGPDYGR